MKKKSNNLNQEVLPMDWKPLDTWPKGYADYIIEVTSSDKWGFDIETEGLNPYDHKFRIISLGISPREKIAHTTYTLNTNEWDINSLKNLETILTNPNNIIIGHNIKFDINWIRVKFEIKVRCMLFDTMYAQYLLNENTFENNLEKLSEQFPDLKGYKDKVNRNDLKRMAKKDVLLYNAKDADASRRLFDVFIPKLEKEGLLPIMNTSMEVLPVLSKMETKGIYLDKEWANKERIKLFDRCIECRLSINQLSKMSVDPGEFISMRNLLYKRLELPVEVYTDKNEPAINKEAIQRGLEYIRDKNRPKTERILREVLEYRKNIKLLSTYYQPIPRWTAYDGRVHTTYRLGKQSTVEGIGGTVTGRLSSDNPNLQNIPIGSTTRGMFSATKGSIFYDGDYSQLELRVAAYASQERLMMDAFEEGLDIHTKVMSDITGIDYKEIQERKEYDEDIKVQRVAIKRINFGILYGVQAARLQKLLWLDLGILWELEKCESLINQWLNRYKKVQRWLDHTKRFTVNYGFISMPFGQKRRLPEASFKTGEGRRALRQAINFPIQSTASWICLIGLTLLDKWITANKMDANLLLQVHDSISLEINKEQATNPEDIASKISKVMEVDVLEYIKEIFNVNWNVPLQFKVTWGERWK